MSGDLEAVFCASDLDPVGRNLSQDLTWRLLLASFSQGQCQVTCLNCEQLKFGTESFRLGVIFCTFIKRCDILKPFLKGKILRSSERGVNSILTTILRF